MPLGAKGLPGREVFWRVRGPFRTSRDSLSPMKILPSPVFFATLALAWAGCQTQPGPHGTVVVNFDHPENFADFRSEASATTSETYQKDLRRHLEVWAGRRVPVGQTLTMNFTDIDMAGDLGPMARETRVLRPIYPLRLKFTWSVTDASGKVVKEGTENRVNDFTSLQVGYDRSDPLFHEKTELDEWISRNLR